METKNYEVNEIIPIGMEGFAVVQVWDDNTNEVVGCKVVKGIITGATIIVDEKGCERCWYRLQCEGGGELNELESDPPQFEVYFEESIAQEWCDYYKEHLDEL